MKITYLACLLSLFHGSLFAAGTLIQIGETAINVPTPTGFTPVTRDMARLNQLLDSFVAPDNVRFISFVPEELLAPIQRGETPDMPLSLSLQTNKKTAGRTITTSEFSELKSIVRKQNVELAKKAEQQLPDLFKKVAREAGNQQKLDIHGIVPLPPHEETARSMAYSILLNLTTSDATGQKTNYPGVVTATFLHARGKLMFTYVNGGANDLEWSRQISKDWTAAILAANPSDEATSAKESTRSKGIDWGRVLRSALIGGLAGAVFGLIGYLNKKRRST